MSWQKEWGKIAKEIWYGPLKGERLPMNYYRWADLFAEEREVKMNMNKLFILTRLLLEEHVGFRPEANLVIICDDPEGNPWIMSNAPDQTSVTEYLQTIINAKKEDTIIRHGIQNISETKQ